MAAVFPGLGSGPFESEFATVSNRIEALIRFLDERGIGARERVRTTAAVVADFEHLVTEHNEILDRARTLAAYIHCHLTTDSRDDAAQAAWSRFQRLSSRLSIVGTRQSAWLGSLNTESLISRSEQAASHRMMLRTARVNAAHMMSSGEEELASELSLTGSGSWVKLYRSVASQMRVRYHLDS